VVEAALVLPVLEEVPYQTVHQTHLLLLLVEEVMDCNIHNLLVQ
jgi:hypothetical protein